MSQPGSLCVGIDVSKAILDIAASSAIEQFSVGNDSDGFEAIIAELRMYAIALVLMKATVWLSHDCSQSCAHRCSELWYAPSPDS